MTTEQSACEEICAELVSPTEAHEWLKDGEAVLIDVREADEYEEEHIEGAFLMPLSCFVTDIIKEKAAGRKIIFQCLAGKRAEKACVAFSRVHIDCPIYCMTDAINGWKEAGLPTVVRDQ